MRKRMIFADRTEAGRLLGERLAALDLVRPVVLALPRGGVPVGAAIAAALKSPLDVVFVRKLGAPDQPELAIGAVADGAEPELVLNDKLLAALNIDEAYITATVQKELAVIEQRRKAYEGLRPKLELTGRSVVVTDDGVATGMTMQAALRQVRRRAGSVIAAVPVASAEALAMLRAEADQVVCLSAPKGFHSVGGQYRDFAQVTDEDVLAILRHPAG
ncbi:MAG TPA: phosphoribosyltransferase family protein [Hyphomicrobiaceae bacterium]|nr:phosphoribosyltransferase family protein [Hyphomicrobiaceae bacterium]